MAKPILEPCASCGGRCCNRFAVCVSIFDLLRLEKATGKKADELVELMEAGLVEHRDDPDIFFFDSTGRLETKMLRLKIQKNRECIFFRNAKGCAVHEHAPAVCRTYPFGINASTGKLDYVKSFACHRQWWPEEISRDEAEYRAFIAKRDEQMEKWQKIVREWNAAVAPKTPNAGLDEFLKFARTKAKEKGKAVARKKSRVAARK